MRYMLVFGIVIVAFLLAFSGCSKKVVHDEPISPYKHTYSVGGKRYHPLEHASGYRAKGLASWSGKQGQGRITASGEKYDYRALTCAHKTLPFDTVVRVTNVANGKFVLVRVNDRGPFKYGDGRIIDLSWAAANKLGMLKQGVTKVIVEALE